MVVALALPLVVGSGLVAACGDGEEAVSSSTGGDTADGAGGGHDGASSVAEDARHVAVTGRSFAFEPGEIIAEAGEAIAIVLTSEDGLHDFTIDELDAHVTAESGVTSVGGFEADEPGRYAYYCSVEGHREAGMEGTLVVEG